MTTQTLLQEQIKKFEETNFAKWGGASFECSDFEGMWESIIDWHTQSIKQILVDG